MKPTRLLILFTLGIIATLAILSFGFFSIYEKATEKQLASYNGMTLDGSVLFVDTIMESTKDLLDNISLDSDVSMLLNYENVTASNLLTGLRRLYKYTSSSYFIDSIYIYNSMNETIYVSSPHMPEAIYGVSAFPDFQAADIFQDYSGIKNMEPVFRTFNAYYPSISEVPYISFIRYNTLSKDNASNVIMVNIRQDIFSNLIHQERGIKGGLILISKANESYKILAGNDESFSTENIKSIYSKLDKARDNDSIKLNGQKFIICSRPVLNGHAQLVLLSDERSVASITKTKGYGNSIILMGLLLASCLILTGYLFKHIWVYNQMQLDSIRLNEEEKIRMLEAGKRGRILSFLHSSSSDNLNDIPLEQSGNVILIILSIDHYSTTIADRYEKASERNALKESLCSRLSGLVQPADLVFVTYEDDECCVLCLKDSEDFSLENAKALIEKDFELTLTAISSGPCNTDDLPEKYDIIKEFLSYKHLKQDGVILSLDLLEEQESIECHIPDTTLKKLAEEILSLNTPEVLLTLAGILEKISSSSYRSAQQNLLNLYLTLDDSITKLQVNNGIDNTSMSGSLIFRLYHLDSIHEIYAIVASILESVEQTLASSKNNRQLELVGEITKITQDNFSKNDFSINYVADVLHMSSAYLGKVFKKTTGLTFNEYVLAERMNKARFLLENSESSIDEIVFSVGFNDIPYFYKLFKRINGCTPVKYRQEHRK